LFVVVYAEDRLLGPQFILISAGRHLVVGSGRWARPVRLLVCRRIGPVCSKMPRGPARCVLRRVVGRLLRRAAEKRDEALLSASRRNSATGPGREAAGPWGAREAERHCRLPRELQRAQGIGLPRIQGSRNLKRRFDLDCVADSDCALGSSRLRAVERLSTQIVSSTGERTHRRRQSTLHAKSSSTLSNITNRCPDWQQRSLSEDRRY
jgi:hypothetical protein